MTKSYKFIVPYTVVAYMGTDYRAAWGRSMYTEEVSKAVDESVHTSIEAGPERASVEGDLHC